MAALSGWIADAGSDRFTCHCSADVARFKQVENNNLDAMHFFPGLYWIFISSKETTFLCGNAFLRAITAALFVRAVSKSE